ncbi:MAG: response regulator [Acidobacteria bacterium]|nr:MAG: response regulator [Acidobacteriota bacterium]
MPVRTVLVIDDDEAVLAALPALLGAPDVKVETAATVEEARRRIERRRPDLVITDLCFGPRTDRGGLELISWLRDRHPRTPIVLLTAFDSPEVRAEAEVLGAAGVWSKSLGPGEFVRRSRALLFGILERGDL